MLDLELETIGWQALNFLILFVALYFVLFRPTLSRVREHAEQKQRQSERLAQSIAEADELRGELERRLAAADQEAEAVIGSARDQAEVERAAAVEEARREVERILAEAHVDAYRLKEQELDEFRDDALRAVLDVSSLTIGQAAPAALHDSLVQQLCDSVWEMGQTDMRRVDMLRQSLGDRTPTVVIRTAHALTRDQQGLVARTFAAPADRKREYRDEVEPARSWGLKCGWAIWCLTTRWPDDSESLRGTVADALKERLASGRNAGVGDPDVASVLRTLQERGARERA